MFRRINYDTGYFKLIGHCFYACRFSGATGSEDQEIAVYVWDRIVFLKKIPLDLL